MDYSTYALFDVPLKVGIAQRFAISLAGVTYILGFRYRGADDLGWVMSIADANGVMLLDGKPLTTGRDLLEQFRYLGIGGGLVVQTEGAPDAVPTYDDLGSLSHLFFVVPDA